MNRPIRQTLERRRLDRFLFGLAEVREHLGHFFARLWRRQLHRRVKLRLRRNRLTDSLAGLVEQLDRLWAGLGGLLLDTSHERPVGQQRRFVHLKTANASRDRRRILLQAGGLPGKPVLPVPELDGSDLRFLLADGFGDVAMRRGGRRLLQLPELAGSLGVVDDRLQLVLLGRVERRKLLLAYLVLDSGLNLAKVAGSGFGLQVGCDGCPLGHARFGECFTGRRRRSLVGRESALWRPLGVRVGDGRLNRRGIKVVRVDLAESYLAASNALGQWRGGGLDRLPLTDRLASDVIHSLGGGWVDLEVGVSELPGHSGARLCVVEVDAVSLLGKSLSQLARPKAGPLERERGRRADGRRAERPNGVRAKGANENRATSCPTGHVCLALKRRQLQVGGLGQERRVGDRDFRPGLCGIGRHFRRVEHFLLESGSLRLAVRISLRRVDVLDGATNGAARIG